MAAFSRNPDEDRVRWALEMSKRHYKYGEWAGAIDIDFVLIEGSGAVAKPIAIVEHKHYMANLTLKNAEQPQTYQVRLLRNLANKAELPFFLVRYWPGIWAYEVYPQNGLAREFLTSSREMTEHQYAQFLSHIRGGGHVIPGGLNHELPPKAPVRKAS